MALDRNPWKAQFTSTDRLHWPCPYCKGNRLTITDGSLAEGETADSNEARSVDAWEPEWIDGRFSCLMECGNCKGRVAVAGTFDVHDERGIDALGREVGDYRTYYRPRFFSDPPHIIRLPEDAPNTVTDALVSAFRLYWIDPESCANRIRVAVEQLLTAHRVRRTTGKGKRSFLTLNARIAIFAEQQPTLAQSLDAIRWLGNAGSHPGQMTQDDVLDGFEMLEHILDELYVGRADRIGAIARAINRRRGPRSPRRRKG